MKYILLISGIIIATMASAQDKAIAKVEAAVAELSKAMIDADKARLESLMMDALTYGHSGGKIETKEQAIEAFVSGKSDFVTIDISEQTVQVSGNTAIVRHVLRATTNDLGKPGEVKIRVLLVWQKTAGKWRLLARQAVKIA